MKKQTMNTSIRLDSELYQKIKEDAEREKRSITGQIEYMVLKYYEMNRLLK